MARGGIVLSTFRCGPENDPTCRAWGGVGVVAGCFGACGACCGVVWSLSELHNVQLTDHRCNKEMRGSSARANNPWDHGCKQPLNACGASHACVKDTSGLARSESPRLSALRGTCRAGKQGRGRVHCDLVRFCAAVGPPRAGSKGQSTSHHGGAPLATGQIGRPAPQRVVTYLRRNQDRARCTGKCLPRRRP